MIDGVYNYERNCGENECKSIVISKRSTNSRYVFCCNKNKCNGHIDELNSSTKINSKTFLFYGCLFYIVKYILFRN